MGSFHSTKSLASRKHSIIKMSKNDESDGRTSYITEQIIFNILIRLPGDVIYNVMRYVCREWYTMIHSPFFISSHLKKSSSGLLIQSGSSLMSANFVKTTKCEVDIQELQFQFPGIVLASCNGLVLLVDKKDDTLYVTNPIIKQNLVLPKIHGEICYAYGFAYADSSRVYKVVHYSRGEPKCGILTLGVDKAWRSVDTTNLMSTDYFNFSPLSLGGSVHWTDMVQSVVSLDVETETFKKIPFPEDCYDKMFKLLAMGDSLSLVLSRDKQLWVIWVLTDSKTGHWEKLYDINLQSERCMLERTSIDHVMSAGAFMCLYLHQNIQWLPNPTSLRPLGWSQNGEVFVFRVPARVDFWIVYNVKTQGVHLFNPTGKMKTSSNDALLSYAHVNSLVPLNFNSCSEM